MSDPSDVTGAAVQVRLEGPLFAELENWRRAQPKIIPRSWALRQLLERALASTRRPPDGRRDIPTRPNEKPPGCEPGGELCSVPPIPLAGGTNHEIDDAENIDAD